MAKALLSLLLLGPVIALAQNLPNDFCAGKKQVYFLMPPEVVSEPAVTFASWSPTGEYVLVGRTSRKMSNAEVRSVLTNPAATFAEAPKIELLVWGVSTHKSKVVMETPFATRAPWITWFAGSNAAIAVVEEPVLSPNGAPTGETREVVTTFSAGTGAYRVVTRLSAGDSLSFSKNAPLAAITHTPVETDPPMPRERRIQRVEFFGPDGRLGKTISLPPGTLLSFVGQSPYALRVRRDEDTRKVMRTWQRIDARTGEVGPVEEPKDVPEISNATRLVRGEGAVSASDAMARAKGLWLTSTDGTLKEAALLTTDAANVAEVSPTSSGVLYVTQGAAFVRTMIPVPRAAYEEAKKLAARNVAVSNAKQAALAMLMYSADYDDNLLSNNGDWRSTLAPYLKDRSILDAFNYTFPGGKASAVEKPAETPIGYIEAPGGRAVAYVDGHVKWIPNP